MRTFILANPGEMRSASFESFSSGTWLTSLMDAMEQKLPDFKTIFNKLFSLLIQQPQSSQIFVMTYWRQLVEYPEDSFTCKARAHYWYLKCSDDLHLPLTLLLPVLTLFVLQWGGSVEGGCVLILFIKSDDTAEGDTLTHSITYYDS